MYCIHYTINYTKHVAYVLASSIKEAESKVETAYPTALITSSKIWPYDMVVF